MSHRYIIVESIPEHISEMSIRLRDGDLAEVEATGLEPRTLLWRSYRNSQFRRTVFVDDEIAAMAGLSGAMLSMRATPWLLTTKAVERLPVAFIKEGRRYVQEMLEIHPHLSGYVLSSYTKAIRLLHLLGFSLTAEFPMGINGAPHRTFEIRKAA